MYSKKRFTLLIFIIGLLLFSYTAIRAYLLAFTWDESYSYLQYVRNAILFPEKYEMMDANNHLLNTWMDIQLVKIFGVSEFVLRIPSLIAHLLFLIYSFKLIKRFDNKWLVVASYIIINLNPYLLDFFSLSRGYGLSVGLMMASVYYLYAFVVREDKVKYVIFSVLFALLASISNFVLLNYYLVSFGIIMLIMVYNCALIVDNTPKGRIVQFIKLSILPITIMIASLLLIVPHVLKLKEAGALFYGGNNGFWKDTLNSVLDRCFYELGYNFWFQRLAKGIGLLTLLSSLLFVCTKYLKNKMNRETVFIGVLILLFGLICFSTIVQHKLFGTLYLIERTALFLVVLFSLLFVFTINELAKENKKMAVVTYLVAVFAIIHFILAFNIKYVLEWKSNSDVKEMIADLDKIKVIPKEKNSISIGTPLAFVESINYYRAVGNYKWINTAETSKKVDLRNDYLFLEPIEYSKLNMDSIQVIKMYPLTKNILAKPKYFHEYNKVRLDRKLGFEDYKEKKLFITKEMEYSQGFSYIVNDSILKNKNGELIFNANVMAPDIFKCNLSVIISLENKHGLKIWERAFVKDYVQKAGEWTEIYFTCFIPKDIAAGDELKSYIWNPNKHTLYVRNMELKWLGYD